MEGTLKAITHKGQNISNKPSLAKVMMEINYYEIGRQPHHLIRFLQEFHGVSADYCFDDIKSHFGHANHRLFFLLFVF